MAWFGGLVLDGRLIQADVKNLHRIFNVFERLKASRVKANAIKPLADFRVDIAGNANTARYPDGFQSSGNIDALSHQVIALHDDVAQIDAHPEVRLIFHLMG